jgi:hypothetical protein
MRGTWGAIRTVGLLAGLAAGVSARPAAAQTVTVTSADPAQADQGTTGLDVTITGSGFGRGSQSSFLVTGTIDPGGVTVNSTTYRSSSKLIANITVAAGATVSGYDVVVRTQDGRMGKGIERFAVKEKVYEYRMTELLPIPDQLAGIQVTDLSDNGFASGSSTYLLSFEGNVDCNFDQAVVWDAIGAPATALPVMLDGPTPTLPTKARHISRNGNYVTGTRWYAPSPGCTGNCCGYQLAGVAWERSGSGWVRHDLIGLDGLGAHGIPAHGVSDTGTIAGGTNGRPCLWPKDPAGGWLQPIDIGAPAGYTGATATDLNESGLVVGVAGVPGLVGGHPFYWQCDASGCAVPVPLDRGSFSDFQGLTVNEAGLVTAVVLDSASTFHAVIWRTLGSLPEDLGTLGGKWAAARDGETLGGPGLTVVGASTLACKGKSCTEPQRAMRWRETGMVDLNGRHNGGTTWSITSATGIDLMGRIGGFGTKGNDARGCVLTPW